MTISNDYRQEARIICCPGQYNEKHFRQVQGKGAK